MDPTPGLESAITFGYYVSTLGFLLATVMMGAAVRQFGKSTLGSIFSYFFIGTGIFFAITIFQKLGADFFGIADESMDIWWHLMFYLALISYYFGLRALIGLGSADPSQSGMRQGAEKMWGIGALVIVAAIFVIPSMAEPIVNAYTASPLAALGLHHFLAFLLAGMVGSYLFRAKKSLGQIGRAIANPMIIAIWALALQHLWELQFESWKTVVVTTEVGEGGEKIFLTIAALCVTYAAWRLRTYSKQ
ncbi:MAG: hypothetical protein AAB734_02200 [Patescibacteria group bacterium]